MLFPQISLKPPGSSQAWLFPPPASGGLLFPVRPCASRQRRSGDAEFDQLQQEKLGLFFGAFKLGSDWQRPLSFSVLCFVTSLQENKRQRVLFPSASPKIWNWALAGRVRAETKVPLSQQEVMNEQNCVKDPFKLPPGVGSCCLHTSETEFRWVTRSVFEKTPISDRPCPLLSAQSEA